MTELNEKNQQKKYFLSIEMEVNFDFHSIKMKVNFGVGSS